MFYTMPIAKQKIKIKKFVSSSQEQAFKRSKTEN